MSTFIWNFVLALFWTLMTETFTPTNFMLGFGLGFIILWFTQPLAGKSRYFRKLPQVLGLTAFFVAELLLAGMKVAYYIVRPLKHLQPGVVAIPLDLRGDGPLLLLTAVITLTPGTLSLDISHDKRVLYLHCMVVDDPEALVAAIKNGFERRIMEVMG